jgi:hypothetical protein
MTYKVMLDGTIEVVSYDEESVSLESANEFIEQWLMEQYELED